MKNPAALRLAGLPGDCSPGKRSATGVRQRICSVKVPHPFIPAFRVAKRRQEPKSPGAYISKLPGLRAADNAFAA